MLMGRTQRCVTVMINKCRYTSDTAVLDMFADILPKTFTFFKTTTPLVEAMLLMRRCNICSSR